jgi:hypothetical protein
VVAALSYKNDNRELFLRVSDLVRYFMPRLIANVEKNPMTHFSAIFKYANVGVKRSAGIDAVTGSRLGGNSEFLDCEITSRAVSRDGMLAT